MGEKTGRRKAKKVDPSLGVQLARAKVELANAVNDERAAAKAWAEAREARWKAWSAVRAIEDAIVAAKQPKDDQGEPIPSEDDPVEILFRQSRECGFEKPISLQTPLSCVPGMPMAWYSAAIKAGHKTVEDVLWASTREDAASLKNRLLMLCGAWDRLSIDGRLSGVNAILMYGAAALGGMVDLEERYSTKVKPPAVVNPESTQGEEELPPKVWTCRKCMGLFRSFKEMAEHEEVCKC